MKRIICALLGVLLMLNCAFISYAEEYDVEILDTDSENEEIFEDYITVDFIAENENDIVESSTESLDVIVSPGRQVDIATFEPIADANQEEIQTQSTPIEAELDSEMTDGDGLSDNIDPIEDDVDVLSGEPIEAANDEITIESTEESVEEPQEQSLIVPSEESTVEVTAESTAEPTPAPFTQGYVRVNGGTTAYKAANRQEEAGTFASSSVVYAEVGREGDDFSSSWLKVIFDIEDAKKDNAAFGVAYVLGKDVKVLEETEVIQLYDQWSQDRTIREYRSNLLPVANYKVKIGETPEPTVERTVEPIIEPTVGLIEESATEEETEYASVFVLELTEILAEDSINQQEESPEIISQEDTSTLPVDQPEDRSEELTSESIEEVMGDSSEDKKESPITEVETEVVSVEEQSINDETEEIAASSTGPEDVRIEQIESKEAVVLLAPNNFSVTQVTLNSVRMTWDAVEGAEYYELYREVEASGVWNKVKNIYGELGSNLNLTTGTTYSYKVRAIKTDNGNKVYGLFSEIGEITISDKKVEGVGVERSSLSSVSIQWNHVDSATKYELYRKSSSSEEWTKVKTVYGESTSNLNLISGTTYAYKVRAYIETNFGSFFGVFSDEISITLADIKPQNLTVTKSSSNSVRLEWDQVVGCDHYELFREVNESGSWNKIKNIYGEIGSNLNLENGNTYSYKIRAVFITDTKSFNGEFSDSVEISFNDGIAPPVISRIQQVGSNKAYIEWSPVEKAEKYYLYRSDNGGRWVKVKSTEGSSIMNLALKEAVEYQYKITAAYIENGAEIESADSNVVDFSLGFDFVPITDLIVSHLSTNKVTLRWSDLTEDVSGYTLYRREGTGEWVRIKNVTGLSTNNLNLESGEVYSYYIKAYKYSDQGGYFSPASNIALFWNQKVDGLQINGNELSWNAVADAGLYIVYSNGTEIGEMDTTIYSLSDSEIGSEITVCAVLDFEEESIQSIMSDGIKYAQSDNARFRALLIGETAYTTRLNGPDNDMNFMNAMLNGLSNDYDVIAQQNATLDEIVDLIDIAFDGATNDDVSLFYYSGHGVTGAGEYYSGALQTVDYQYITTGDLAEMLSGIPGRVIVILDSCGSGATISDGTESTMSIQSNSNSVLTFSDGNESEENFSFDAEQFNNGVIEAFSAFDSVISSGGTSSSGGPRKAGELKQTKFYVITGSAYEENSLTTMIDGVWGGVLTRGVAFGTGCSYPSGAYSGAMPADTNSDDGISFSELATYCKNYAGDRQHVLSYSASPNYIIFSRISTYGD